MRGVPHDVGERNDVRSAEFVDLPDTLVAPGGTREGFRDILDGHRLEVGMLWVNMWASAPASGITGDSFNNSAKRQNRPSPRPKITDGRKIVQRRPLACTAASAAPRVRK